MLICMPYQDIILAGGTVVAVIALFPSILGKSKPAMLTSLLNGMVMVVFAGVYLTLSLWFTAGMVGLLSFLWLILAFQKHRLKK